jgi:hypoxanthine phosphoribosyltransferase
MKKVTLGDKHFKLFIESKKILAEIDQLSLKINEHYANKRPIFICVLNGAFLFASELIKDLTMNVKFHL